MFPPCSLVTDIEATLYSPTGSCDQAHCTTLCSNSEDVTHFRPGGGGHYRTVVCSSRVLRFSGSTTLCDGVEPISVGREASCLSAFPFQETLQAQLEETHEEDAAWRDINQLMLKKNEKKKHFCWTNVSISYWEQK